MKTISQLVAVVSATMLLVACGQKTEEADYYASSDSTSVIMSSAAAGNLPQNRKFIQKAEARFRVADVYRTTEKIEMLVQKNGGFVILSDLQTHELSREQVLFSKDSLWDVQRYSIENTLTFRVPSKQLDTTLRQLGKWVEFLDHRTISAEEVTLDFEASDVTQNRLETHSKKIREAIDKKGVKLDDIVTAENTLKDSNESLDYARINTKKLIDDIKYSTVSVTIYQPEGIAKNTIVNTQQIIKAPFGFRLTDALSFGWVVFEETLLFIVKGWAIGLLAVVLWYIWRNRATKKSGAIV